MQISQMDLAPTRRSLYDCNNECVNDVDGDGVCDELENPDARDLAACNFEALPADDDGLRLFLDALGECGWILEADADMDGICDDVDPCVGELDARDVCNGPGAVYDCGCSDIPAGECDCDGNVLDECGVCGGNGIAAGDCDCDGNQLDALGECGGPCEADANGNGICDDAEIPGCMAGIACNYNAAATEDDGSCDFAHVLQRPDPTSITP